MLTTLTYINWTHIHIRVGLIPVWLTLKLGLDDSTYAGVDLEMVCKIEIRFTTNKARFGSIKKQITRDYAFYYYQPRNGMVNWVNGILVGTFYS